MGFSRESRLFLVDNGLGILANPEDENLLDIQDQMGGVLVAPGLQSGLVQTPSALNRWLEEAIILDADSIHDCIAAIKPDILVVVDKYRDEELAERRERRKKQQEEEALRRQKEEEEREKNKDANTVQPSSAPSVTMDVAQTEAASVTAETPSFSSFFHGFNMQSTPGSSSMASTPLLRPNDHAETLATSIVEAVLGPAMETVSNQARQHQDNHEISETAPIPQGFASSNVSEQSIPIVPETPVATARDQSILAPPVSNRVDLTPIVERPNESYPTITPFNPIPNATPNAPYVSRFRPDSPSSRSIEEALLAEGNFPVL